MVRAILPTTVSATRPLVQRLERGRMLYLLRADGRIDEVQGAETAALNERQGCLICYGPDGSEVARYERLEVTLFSSSPFPDGEDATPVKGSESPGDA